MNSVIREKSPKTKHPKSLTQECIFAHQRSREIITEITYTTLAGVSEFSVANCRDCPGYS